MGAAMVMVMPPYHGATFRFGEAQVRAFYQGVSDRIGIPIMIQDAPAAGTPLSPAFLAGMAREIEQVSYFKMETAGAAGKLRELIALGGEAVEGPWDGEEAITLLADLEAGVTGSMTGGGYADGIRPIIEAHRRGDVEAAYAQYQRWLPLINHENRQAGFLAAKALMKEGGVIACDAPRAPWPPLHPETRRQLLAIARRLDPLVLRWGVERKRRAGGAGPIRGRPAGPCRPPLASGREHSVPLPLTRSYPTAGKIPAVPNHPAGRPCSRSFQSRACPSDMHPGSRRSRAWTWKSGAEIFALLGPNGAGKTTLISIICGIVNATEGRVLADGHDIVADYRKARAKIGLVPQEISTDAFESVWNTVSFSRGLFGKPANPALIEKILRDLSLWDKKDNRIMALSGGMKRRVMIAKALSHEPQILFLDEPTAGVDVELRRGMWDMVRRLRENGVTIILTTHYIEEAQEMADRVGVIRKGEIILVEEKHALMEKLGKRRLALTLKTPLAAVPSGLEAYALELAEDGRKLVHTYGKQDGGDISLLLRALAERGVEFTDLNTSESSLEEIFVSLVHAQS